MDKFKTLFFQYFDKLAIVIAIGLLVYSCYNFYKSTKVEDSIKKVKEFTPVIENNLRSIKAPEPTELNYALNLKSSFSKIPENELVKTAKRYKPIAKNIEHPDITISDAFHPGNTEILFKGATYDKALIHIIKNEAGVLIEQSFIARLGETIGGHEPVKGNKLIDFMTGCTLLEVISDVKKRLTTTKKIVNLNENGEFIGTEMRDEPYYIDSTKIKYKNDRLKGKIQELWLGETVNIGTITTLLNKMNHVSDTESTIK